MKIKIKLISCMIFFLLFMYIAFPPLTTQLKISNQLTESIMVSVTGENGKVDVELEEYLIGVLAGEMPASFELEALKAQAVASRSFVYARKLKVDDTVSSQVYQQDVVLREKWGNDYLENVRKIKKAIEETKGQVLTYKGEIIHAFFFSSSNGKTNNSEDYWVSAIPYLRSIDSKQDMMKKDNKRKKEIKDSQMKDIFKEEIMKIEVMSHFESGYVKEVKVNQRFYTGREIREMCGLSSSSFSVEKTSTGFLFVTEGSGHGVGMSQYGAQGMALEGYSYEEILKHYYQGVEIMNK